MSLSSFSAQDRERAGIQVKKPHWKKAGLVELPNHKDRQFRGGDVEQLYWQIGDVAKMFGVRTQTIRNWETRFGVFVKGRVGRRGDRRFTKEDIATFKEIYRLLKVEGYKVEGAKRQLAKRSSVDVRGEQAKPIESTSMREGGISNGPSF